MMHDDGQHVEGLGGGRRVVLVGVSRTSKTPTSIYLANRGIRTAQRPAGAGHSASASTGDPEKAAGRQPACHARAADPGAAEPAVEHGRSATTTPISIRQAVADEVAFARRLSAKFNWALLDVTRRSIEETAAAVMKLLCRPAAAAASGMIIAHDDLARQRSADSRLAKPRAQNAARPMPASISRPCRRISTSGACSTHSGLSAPGEIALLLAREKALFVSSQKPGRYVVGADPDAGARAKAVQQANRPRRRPRSS